MFQKKFLFLLIAALWFVPFMPSTIHVNADPQLGVFIPPSSMTDNSGYYGEVEALFLLPTGAEPFAILSDSNTSDDDFTGLNDNGPADVVNAEYGRNGGFRANIGRNVPNNPLDLSVEFTGIFSTANTTAETNGSVGIIASNSEGDNSADIGIARTNLDMFYADMMAKYNVKFGQNSWLFTMGAGLRVAYVEHDIDRQFAGIDCDNSGWCQNRTNQEYWGVGPRVSTKLGWDVGSGFNIFTSANLTLLTGEMETLNRNTDDTHQTGDNDVNMRINSSRNIPILDMRIGVKWAKQITDGMRLNLMLGYEFQNWFDFRDKFVSVDDDGANAARETIDLGLEGPFLRVGAEF
jgi:hypothetical protein